MQAERVQVLVQQAAAGNPEAFLTLVQEFAPDLRLALAVHLDQPGALMTVEPAAWTAVRGRLGEFIGDPPFASWIQQVAVDAVSAHLAQADRRAIDHQDALSHQIIEQCREALADGRELQVGSIRARIGMLSEATRTLLQRRYRDRQRSADIAASLMISEPELASSLAAARAACDWRGLANPPAAGDRLLPPLIEDWLNNTIDVDSRALLATNLGRDPERAAQFARQVRVHLALGACLQPFTRDDAIALVRQTGLGSGDSGRVMMGEGPRPAAAPARSASSEARRPARMATSNRQTVPNLDDDAPRSSSLPWFIGGGMVLVGGIALLAMSLGGGSSRATRTPEPTPAPAAASVPAPTHKPPEQVAPASGGVLRVERGQTAPTTAPPPRIAVSGQIVTGRAYINQPLELRADLSHTYGVTGVEFWKGEERVASLTAEPYVWTWAKPVAGPATFTARALGRNGTLATSAPAPVTVHPALGGGGLMREWWNGVGGATIAEGVGVQGYPDRPQGQEPLVRFVSRDWGDNYLERLRGFVVPPADGEYVFWIAGDDESELWLSEDDTRARLHRLAVAPVGNGGGIAPEEWERVASQRSASLTLVRGRRYYVEVLHKEGGGDDHVEVGWKLPDGTLERPIPGAHLMPPTEPVPPGAVPVVAVAPIPAPAAPAAVVTADPGAPVLVLWDGETKAGGSGYASSGIAKVAGSGRGGGMGLQAGLSGDFANLGWNWCGWFPDDGGTDVRGGNALSFWMRIDGTNRPTQATVIFQCGPKSIQARSNEIDLDALVPAFADSQWHQVVIPFERLTAPRFDLAKVWEFNLKIGGKGNMAATVAVDDVAVLRLTAAQATAAPTTVPATAATAPTAAAAARRPDLMIWDGEGANGGSGYKGFGAGGQSPLDLVQAQGRVGNGLRARLGGGNAASVGWNWHAWSSDQAGTDLTGFAAFCLSVRFTGSAAPQQVVMRLSCSPREPSRRTADINLLTRQPNLLDGTWHQVVVPLAELVPPGQDFDRAKAWEVSFDLSAAGNLDGTFDVDEIGALRSLTPPPPVTWKVVRAINLGGEATEIEGVKFQGHRQAEAEGASPAGSHQPGPWLSEMNWLRGSTALGEIKRDQSMDGQPIKLDGKGYAKGLGVHAPSELVYALDGRYSGFTAVAGLDDIVQGGEVIFQAWLDGQKVWDSGVVRKGQPKPVAIPLVGRKELRLVVDSNGPNDWDHGDWANAQFLTPGGDDGVLQVTQGKRTTSTFVPKPAVDAKARALLTTALGGTKEGLAFRVKVANGASRVWVWVAENGNANSRQFDLTVEGATLPGVGSLAAGAWEKLGPIEVNVADGMLDVGTTALKGMPQIMGILIEQPVAAPATPTP